MKHILLSVLFGCVATALGAPVEQVKWCVTSAAERNKCSALALKVPVFTCVQRLNAQKCILSIKAGEADAVTLDGGYIYSAGLSPHFLQPIISENYGPGRTDSSCYYAVAVVSKTAAFSINDLKGKKSCHTGLGKTAGWNIPIGTLVALKQIIWSNNEDQPIEIAVGEFFNGSCVPGAAVGSNLCALCPSCARSSAERYYGNEGAFKCLQDGKGDVAFVNHLTVPESEKPNYQLLCRDGRRAPINDYKTCHLAKVPGHAVVTRRDAELAELIYTSLTNTNDFNLFSSSEYGAANLMFQDSTKGLVKLPDSYSSFLYLGAEYFSAIRSLMLDVPRTTPNSIIWCAVGSAETKKCVEWSIKSFGGDTQIECATSPTVDGCIEKIMREEADAMSVDVYTAGQCGLVPAMVEQYDRTPKANYYVVAVVKKGSQVTWKNLKGKRSCHAGLDCTASWVSSMGQIRKEIGSCDFSTFFPSGCAPGSNLTSTFCNNCIGGGQNMGDDAKCRPSKDELYYGYGGAFRCLVEDSGTSWSAAVNPEDYELICPEGGPEPISNFASCNLAGVRPHAVMTRSEIREEVVRVLSEQQERFGNDAESPFKMFKSDGRGKDLLFTDSTRCLQQVPITTAHDFLGAGYVDAVESLRQCNDATFALEKSCRFHSCGLTNEQEILGAALDAFPKNGGKY
ncbi:hypothetical protein NHX12_004242 [Muraenolepis orangiensis]|uniref:Serotransferrin n=1 Tax=Muraenolepis orangiensis TaxID=630683 RepID=A0A9Q0DV02_9TELE|nr:hypothetical protein NHX12_004242 [Muraenolepis orangiensis]